MKNKEIKVWRKISNNDRSKEKMEEYELMEYGQEKKSIKSPWCDSFERTSLWEEIKPRLWLLQGYVNVLRRRYLIVRYRKMGRPRYYRLKNSWQVVCNPFKELAILDVCSAKSRSGNHCQKRCQKRTKTLCNFLTCGQLYMKLASLSKTSNDWWFLHCGYSTPPPVDIHHFNELRV